MNASFASTFDYLFFSDAQGHLDFIIKHLGSAGNQDHAVTEEYIRTQGDEVLRLLLQGYLSRQTQNESRALSVTCSDGQDRNHARKDTSRTLASLFGKVENEQTNDLLILSFDGKGLVMLPDDLK